MKTSGPIALKEWAVAVRALEEGEQILIMRKGGIAEETRDFQVQSDSFYLFPTYEHQKKHLLKDEYKHRIDESLSLWNPQDATVGITCFARVEEDIEILDERRLDRLRPFHIWTDQFAEERLKWKRKNPLHVLLLRVYKLDRPIRIPIVPAYTGCKSWIRLEAELPETGLVPVLDERRFQSERQRIKDALDIG